MRRMGPVGLVFVIFVLGILSEGCGSKAQPITENPLEGVALTDVGEAYRVYTINNNRPPSKIDDLMPMEMMCPTGVRAIKKGDVIVQWGAALPDISEEPGKVSSPNVLAYQKQVPEQGGYVLLLDRTMKKMTADEFKAAPKAGK